MVDVEYALELCPRCGLSFEPGKIYRVEEIAVLAGVSVNNVYKWMREGQLQYHYWARAGFQVIRVVFAVDYLKFRRSHFIEPDNLVPGTLAHRIKMNGQRAARLAGRASVIARRAKRQAQQTANQVQNSSSPAQDPGSK